MTNILINSYIFKFYLTKLPYYLLKHYQLRLWSLISLSLNISTRFTLKTGDCENLSERKMIKRDLNKLEMTRLMPKASIFVVKPNNIIICSLMRFE